MDNKFVYQKEENSNILMGENKSSFQNNIIEGSGSESQLDSINSQKKEITHSSLSSYNPIALSNDSLNNGNENKIKKSNDKSSLFNSNEKNNNKNSKEFNLSKISEIIKNEQGSFKTEDMSLIMKIDSNNSNSEDMKIESFDTMMNENEDDVNNTINLISQNLNQDNNDKGNNYDKKEDESDKNKKNEQLKECVKKMMKKGFIPFFIQIEGFNPSFSYGNKEAKVKNVIEEYFKMLNISQDNNYLFYYNDKLINIESSLRDLNLKYCGLIKGKLQ